MKYNTNNLTKAPKKSWFSFARICKILTCFFVITTFCMIFFRLTLLGQASD